MEDNPKVRPPDFSSKKVLMKYSLQKSKDRNNIKFGKGGKKWPK